MPATTLPVRTGCPFATEVVDAVRRGGKHALPAALLARLDAQRRRTTDPYVAAFLDGVLDRHDGRFHNRTYLGLALLDELLTGLDPDRLAALLMADVVRFERRAAERPSRGPADDRPDPRTARVRIRHARRFVDLCRGTGPGAPLPVPTDAVAAWLDATALPVDVRHDEYFLLRVLQCHELTFTVPTADVRAATRALRRGAAGEATTRLEHAPEVFGRAALLFRIVATMRPEAFHAFRVHTEGASAIQSEAYKRFLAACRTPDAERLTSDAFTQVPAVRAEVLAGQDTLDRARRETACSPRERTALDDALRALEDAHRRWTTTHLGLAVRMLGDAPGSGRTAGVPYLAHTRQYRLFGGRAS